MRYYIKERFNPQFPTPYYVACGQLPARVAQKMERPLYGAATMHRFETLEAYTAELKRLSDAGARFVP